MEAVGSANNYEATRPEAAEALGDMDIVALGMAREEGSKKELQDLYRNLGYERKDYDKVINNLASQQYLEVSEDSQDAAITKIPDFVVTELGEQALRQADLHQSYVRVEVKRSANRVAFDLLDLVDLQSREDGWLFAPANDTPVNEFLSQRNDVLAETCRKNMHRLEARGLLEFARLARYGDSERTASITNMRLSWFGKHVIDSVRTEHSYESQGILPGAANAFQASADEIGELNPNCLTTARLEDTCQSMRQEINHLNELLGFAPLPYAESAELSSKKDMRKAVKDYSRQLRSLEDLLDSRSGRFQHADAA